MASALQLQHSICKATKAYGSRKIATRNWVAACQGLALEISHSSFLAQFLDNLTMHSIYQWKSKLLNICICTYICIYTYMYMYMYICRARIFDSWRFQLLPKALSHISLHRGHFLSTWKTPCPPVASGAQADKDSTLAEQHTRNGGRPSYEKGRRAEGPDPFGGSCSRATCLASG